ncbi:UNVERIFIED_CONTAM: Glycerol kinase [Sesamum calycinum]|uniref:Glycerol kinase n=1 Tax=Sesamum calycinum TaxID=2727403 RepID=A0AAW2SZZ7_9LAMI
MAGEQALIGSIDQGTTSTRFIIYDRSARPLASHQVEFTQFYPQSGWVEHDPMEILESVRECIAKAIDKATAAGHNVVSGLKAIGLTNQRETTVIWSRSTGCPLHKAIVWMDVRTSSICSAVKLLWLLENVDAVKEAVKKGDALFGTIDTWLIWNLTAMLGQACRKGEAKSTYGTGAFILLNTGEEIIKSNHGLLSTLAYKLGPKAPTNYALEGSIAIAGAAVQWLRDSLGIIKTASEIEKLALEVDSSGGFTLYQLLTDCLHHGGATMLGEFALGLQGCWEKGEVKNDKGEFLLRVDGGATVNNLLMQIQADILGSPVVRPADIETTALGAAYAAGLAVGVWTEDQIFSSGEKMEKDTVFRPAIDEQLRKQKVESWCKAVTRTFDLADLSL